MAKQCCRPTSSGSDIDPDNRAAIAGLQRQLREAQESNAAKEAALEADQEYLPTCKSRDCGPRPPYTPLCPFMKNRAALSGTDGGWLPPEVREQVRDFVEGFADEGHVHYIQYPHDPEACDTCAANELLDTLDALEEK